MPRISPIDPKHAQGKQKELLDTVQEHLGKTPNMMRTMAQSPAVLNAYLQFGQALGASSLSGKLREQLANAIAGANRCAYCASAHTALGQLFGVDAGELQRNLEGESADKRTLAAITFVRAVVDKRGWISDAEFKAVRDAGYSEAQVAELIAVVALNTFTNYFNHIAQTEIDFPKVEVRAPALV